MIMKQLIKNIYDSKYFKYSQVVCCRLLAQAQLRFFVCVCQSAKLWTNWWVLKADGERDQMQAEELLSCYIFSPAEKVYTGDLKLFEHLCVYICMNMY